ncbi:MULTISPECIES: GNAT family N-acetyltransferase [Brevibacillus]|jgi:diamine N-acetyltransferase|uniref:GNAT family protein n=1 Tax=Brevibacillus thermoruber TaxID=33942 RepID=A0A9X3TUS1_9BACL|nr:MULTISPECIES: GNAT family protein [Brevibacillus]MDA5110790.1 GNAT family protein [Brevibacillus thermoruber]TRY27943.1 GNAT family N-acetyltransferase [Brevibacillus sp. LEMMJ03]
MRGNFVRLQALEEEDYKLFSQWVCPSKVSALARGRQDFATEDEIRKDIVNGSTRYATVVTHDGKKIGFVSWETLKYEGSYMLGGVIGDPELWDMGYGAEASLLLMDYLFHFKNAHKIQFINGLHNMRSVRFLIKNKVTIEGILRDHFFLDGEYHDAVISSILRDEYYGYSEPEDMIPKSEKQKIREELYEYLQGYWKEECFPKLLKQGEKIGR